MAEEVAEEEVDGSRTQQITVINWNATTCSQPDVAVGVHGVL